MKKNKSTKLKSLKDLKKLRPGNFIKERGYNTEYLFIGSGSNDSYRFIARNSTPELRDTIVYVDVKEEEIWINNGEITFNSIPRVYLTPRDNEYKEQKQKLIDLGLWKNEETFLPSACEHDNECSYNEQNYFSDESENCPEYEQFKEKCGSVNNLGHEITLTTLDDFVASSDEIDELSKLNFLLKSAINANNYERCAELRDQIKSLREQK